MGERRTVELLASRDLSSTVKELSFGCVDGRPLDHEPGQWVNLDVECDGSVVRRAYSIASAPDPVRPERFALGVTLVEGGQASQRLHQMRPGERLLCDGPYGFFTREGLLDQPTLLVGTGSGLCPLRAMIADELRRDAGPPLTLLFGCRTRDDILWGDELRAWAQGGRLTLHVTLSRPDPRWQGMTGYVQTHLVELIDPAARPHVFVCGLSKMIKSVREVLKRDLGFDRKLIHSERYD